MNEFLIAVLLAFAILVGFVVLVRFSDRGRAKKELASLISNGRAISASRAIEEYEGGIGVLVKNASLLPGSWWFLRNTDYRDDCDLVTTMRQFGYVVVCNDSHEREAIEAYIGKVEVMLEPFDE
jgi:hypothetical protein